MVETQDEVRRLMKHHEGMPRLKPLGKPCHDCAVVDGFYLPFAQALSTLPEDEIKYHSERWFCHNNCDRACAGNIEFQRAKARKG